MPRRGGGAAHDWWGGSSRRPFELSFVEARSTKHSGVLLVVALLGAAAKLCERDAGRLWVRRCSVTWGFVNAVGHADGGSPSDLLPVA